MKVALITAASKGIGAGIAKELASQGYRVALLARSEAVHQVADQLGGIAVTGSVTQFESVERLVTTAMEKWGRVDAVVNNTGHPPKGGLLELSDDQWHEGYLLIVESAMRMARLVTPIMERQGSGAFVSISSYAAIKPELARPVSSVMRAALGAWTKLHAEYCAPKGIRVNAVMPGFVDSYEVAAETIATIPMGRVGRVEELAKMVAWLLSEDASYVTGQTMLLDGGMVKGL
ncbi:short-chain dehydrogenase/reductase SDR [Candidatus Koribacter versatilis Ellin345]|uniref:Short-chain dehydrogenase/reductase SDR n=1 Tax=Koribacter versatilis (strain Ellin345) TaxID=204669 RepID=Q1IR92_KORVE|nr:SDR family oxidoreductase [Candidatus Koribacter versatilis]ABF40608.1 short-chain dehydrogenase/reductase SDR [Candidatus Koribacter versatilis Ellin345]